MNLTILGFIRKELVQTLRDPRLRILLFMAPLVQMTIFGIAISNEVKNVTLAAYYRPNDRLARHIQEHCLSSGWFVPAKNPDPDPFHSVWSGNVEAALVAPYEGLTRQVGRGRSELQLLVNATNVVRAQQIESYVRNIVLETLKDDHLVEAAPGDLSFDVRVLYNPQGDTAFYMVPAVICMVLCIITVVLTSMSFAKEKEVGTFETLIAAPVKTWEVMLGKTVPYVLLGVADIPLLVLIAVYGFGVPVRGYIWMLGLSGVVFICTTVSIGTLISTFARTQQQAMMAGFLFLFPAVMLSGIIYPVENMPESVRYFAYLDPIRYFVSLLRNIMLKGGGLDLVLTYIGGLVALAVACIWLSARRFKHTL